MLERIKTLIGRLNDPSLMCFSVAAGAFVAAGIGAIVNHMLAGWMAVGGMVGVGLFFLAMGLFSLGSKTNTNSSSGKEDEAALSAPRSIIPIHAETKPSVLDRPSDPAVIPQHAREKSAPLHSTDDRQRKEVAFT